MIRSETPVDAARKLAAPKLRGVTLSFWTVDQDGGLDRGHFGMEEGVWMRRFAEVRRREDLGRRLEKVVVEMGLRGDSPACLYEPLGPEYFVRSPVEDRAERIAWPWRYLEEAREGAMEFGLEIEFAVDWTREEWDRIVRGEKWGMVDELEDL